jgi:hypothetical protein
MRVKSNPRRSAQDLPDSSMLIEDPAHAAVNMSIASSSSAKRVKENHPAAPAVEASAKRSAVPDDDVKELDNKRIKHGSVSDQIRIKHGSVSDHFRIFQREIECFTTAWDGILEKVKDAAEQEGSKQRQKILDLMLQGEEVDKAHFNLAMESIDNMMDAYARDQDLIAELARKNCELQDACKRCEAK